MDKLDFLKPECVTQLIQIVIKAGSIVQEFFGKNPSFAEKEEQNYVTAADTAIEEFIFSQIKKFWSDLTLLGEEGSGATHQTDNKFLLKDISPDQKVLILDPIDGTNNFLRGIPQFSISLALAEGIEPYLGIMYFPKIGLNGRLYFALRGKGAFVNYKRIESLPLKTLKHALVTTGFIHYDDAPYERQINLLRNIGKRIKGIRRSGAATYDFAMVGEGHFDLFFEQGLKPWDVAAGIIFVRELGGVVKTYENKNYTLHDHSLIAGHPVLVQSFINEFISQS